MGGGGKGGGQSTQYSGVTIPPEVLARYNKATDRAETASQTPWQNYEGTFVAPVNETQTAGYGTMMNGQSYTQAGWEAPNAALQQGVAGAQPLLGQAGAQYNNALQQGQQGTQNALAQGQQAFNTAAPLTSGALAGAQPYQQAATGLAGAGMQAVNPTGLNIQQFYNPYQQDVVQATMAQLGQQQAQQRMDQRGSMIKEGTFGGDRGGIANANMVNQQNLATGNVLSGLNQGNYNQALQAAQQQQGVGLGAAQANRAALQQGAGQMLGIGQQGFQQGMGAAQQLYGQGMGLANLQGQMGQQAYGQGIGGGQALQGLGTAGYGMMSDAAARQAGFAGQAFGQNMQTAQGQTGFGTLQQQTQQAQDSAVYNQWLQERGYPFQTSQFYTNAVLGTGPLSGTGAYGGSFTPQPFFSDERLKENITSVGTTHDGKDVLAYNMAGDPRTQIGLSAQDIAKDKPEAVGNRGGYLTLDYDKALEGAKEPRQHAAIGGGADPFSDGLGGLAQTANIGAGAGYGFGSLPDIVAMQKRALGSNAPGSIKPPSTAGLAGDPAMKGPGNPPPPAAAAPGLSPVVAAALASAVPAAAVVNDPGSGDGGAGNSVDSGATSGPGPGPGPGNGVGSGTGETYAEGGRAGFAQAGDVGDSYPGYMAPQQSAGFGDILKSNQALYQLLLGQNVAGTGNQGVAGGLNIPSGQAKPSAVLKPPEMKAPAAQKSTVDEAGSAIDKVSSWGSKAGDAYKGGKDALYGSPAKGKPGDKDYVPETGGLFGRGGRDNYREGWWHEHLGTDNWTTPEAVSYVPGDEVAASPDYTRTLPGFERERGGTVTGLGRAGFADAGEVAPFDETSILDPELFAPREASKPLEPPDPTGKAKGQEKDKTASTALGLAALGAGFIPGVGPAVSAGLSGLRMFAARGGRTYAEGGEVNDNQPEPGLAPAAEATGEVHYGIFSRSQGHKMIGRATTMSGARRVRTQRDSAFGGSDHFIKPIPTTRKRWAGGRLGFADAGEVIEPSDNEAYLQALEKQRKLEGLSAATTEPAPELSPLAKAIEEGRSRQEAQGALGAAGRGIQVAQAPSPTPIVAVPPPPIPSADDAAGERATVPQRAPVPAVPGTSPLPPPAPTQTRPPAPPPIPTEGPAIIANTRRIEGSTLVRDSNGAWTRHGINQGANPDINVHDLTPERADEVYKTRYYDKMGIDNLPPNMRAAVYDAGVNSGVDTALGWLRQSGNDLVKFNQLRHEHLQRLLDSQPDKYKTYGQSWTNRLVEHGGQPLRGYSYTGTGTGTDTGTGTGTGNPNDPSGMSVPAGLGALDPNPNTSYWGTRNGDWWARNESYLLPLLSGIGGMLSSPSHTLAGSIGSGLVAGAEQYMTRGQRQQGIDIQSQTARTQQAAQVMEQYRQTQIRIGADPTNKSLQALATKQLAHIDRLLGGTGMMPNKMYGMDTAQFSDPRFDQLADPDNPKKLMESFAATGDEKYRAAAIAALGRIKETGNATAKDGSTNIRFDDLHTASIAAEAQRKAETLIAETGAMLSQPGSQLSQAWIGSRITALKEVIATFENGTPAQKAKVPELRNTLNNLQAAYGQAKPGSARGGRIGRAFGGLTGGLGDLATAGQDDAVGPPVQGGMPIQDGLAGAGDGLSAEPEAPKPFELAQYRYKPPPPAYSNIPEADKMPPSGPAPSTSLEDATTIEGKRQRLKENPSSPEERSTLQKDITTLQAQDRDKRRDMAAAQIGPLREQATAAMIPQRTMNSMFEEALKLPDSGFGAQGVYPEYRKQIGSMLNSFATAFGGKPIVDLNDQAALEVLLKDRRVLAGAAASAMGQHANAAMSAVEEASPGPGMSKTGFLRVLSNMYQTSQMLQDRANFYENWAKTKDWDMDGVAQAFLKSTDNLRKYSDAATVMTIPKHHVAAVLDYRNQNPQYDDSQISSVMGEFDKKWGHGASDAIMRAHPRPQPQP